MALVQRIKEVCKEQGITVAELERKCGIGNGIIARWKTSKPSYDRLAKVASALGVSVDYLQTGAKQKEPPPTQQGGELDAEFIRLFQMLTPEQQARELAYLRELTGGRGM